MKTAAPAEARVLEILEQYLRELEAGRAPNREALLAKHPDLAESLAASFRALDFVHDAERTLQAPSREEPPAAGRELGDYRLLREIGRGGMAVVYEAEQASLGRRVALKVLPFAAVLDPRHLQRFKNEAQAAANLHHTNIVPVYAVGCERGVHYYAMQYVEGESLAVAIHGLKGGGDLAPSGAQGRGAGEGAGSPDGPRSPISSQGSNRDTAFIRMAASLGAQAAEALDHAHQLGIVHRDVKPGNLLVDAAGALWITDFGLARSVADAGLTVTGELLGTIRYMSPEQALAKRVPVDHRTDVYSLGATLYELFTLEPAFPGDDPHKVIQDIAFREPTLPRRLNPALPTDIETVLLKAMSKDPAGRYATAQEMADDLKRYLADRPILARRPSLPTRLVKWARRHRGVVAAALAVLLVGTVALAITENRTRDAFRSADDALKRAEQNLDLAHQAVDEFLMQLGIKGLQDERLPTNEKRALLGKALEFYDKFLAERDDPEAAANRGEILHSLGDYARSLEAFDGVLATRPDHVRSLVGRGHMLWHLKRYDEALAACDRAIEIDPGDASAHSDRGHVLDLLGRSEEALAAFDRALAIDPGHADAHWYDGNALLSLERFDEALAAYDRVIELDPGFAKGHCNRGNALRSLGRLDEALAAFDRAIEADPDLLAAQCNRASILHLLGRSEEAVTAFDHVIEIDPDNATAHSGRGNALQTLRCFDEALAACDRAIEIDPGFPQAHTNRGNALESLGRLDEALSAFDRAIEIDPKSAGAHTNRGNALRSLGRLDEALAAYDRAVEIDPGLAEAHSNRGAGLDSLGRFDEALQAFDRAIEIDPGLADLHGNRGGVLHSLGRFDEALAACDRAIEIDPGLAAAHCSRGATLQSLGRLDEALGAYDRAIAVDPNDATAYANRALVLVLLGRFDEALAACDRAIEIDPNHAVTHSYRGSALYSLGRFGEALAACDRAAELDPKLTSAHAGRGEALASLGRTREALAAYDRAIDLGARPPATLLNEIAWRRATSPDPEVRDAARAVELAKRTVGLSAQEGGFWNTLGVALCRAAEWEEALRAFEKSMELRDGGDAYDWFFIAMAQGQLGRKDEARRWYDKAVAWAKENKKADDEELERFRVEAAALLDEEAR